METNKALGWRWKDGLKAEGEFSALSLFGFRLCSLFSSRTHQQATRRCCGLWEKNQSKQTDTRRADLRFEQWPVLSLKQRHAGRSSLRSSWKTKARANSCGLAAASRSQLAALTRFVRRLFSSHWIFSFCWPLRVRSGPDQTRSDDPQDQDRRDSSNSSLLRQVSLSARLFRFALLSYFSQIVSSHFEMSGRVVQPFVFLILPRVDRGCPGEAFLCVFVRDCGPSKPAEPPFCWSFCVIVSCPLNCVLTV